MPGHDPYRALSATAVADPPAPLTGSAAPQPRVPKGSVAKVVEWIDNGKSQADRERRARAALDAEQAKDKPRAGVVTHAQSVLG